MKGPLSWVRVIRGILLNVELVECQLVHERLHQVVCGEVEDQAEKNGDGQSGERFLEDGEEEQRQTQALRERRDKIKHILNDCVLNKIKS